MTETPAERPARFVWTVSAGNLLSPALTIGGILVAISLWAGGVGPKSETTEKRLDAIDKKVETIGVRVEAMQIAITRSETQARMMEEQSRQIAELGAQLSRRTEELASLRVAQARAEADIRHLQALAAKGEKR